MNILGATLVTKYAYKIQENGQVTLPVEFRRRYGLKKGDMIVFEETGDGLLISPDETLLMSRLETIGEALKAKGITLEELLTSGAEIREEIYAEKYASGTDD
jgi:AbrB family looped-hinge helix DNA binding protein